MPTQLEILQQKVEGLETWAQGVIANSKFTTEHAQMGEFDGSAVFRVNIGNAPVYLSLNRILLEAKAQQVFVENEYLTIAELLSNQSEQTNGRVQFVVDASGDISVDSGKAYYEKLASTGDLYNDYRKLTDEETAYLDQSQTANVILIEGEKFIWLKRASNTTDEIQQHEVVIGCYQNYRYELKYNSGDSALFTSYSIIGTKQRLY